MYRYNLTYLLFISILFKKLELGPYWYLLVENLRFAIVHII